MHRTDAIQTRSHVPTMDCRSDLTPGNIVNEYLKLGSEPALRPRRVRVFEARNSSGPESNTVSSRARRAISACAKV